jgi:hypothetical protein
VVKSNTSSLKGNPYAKLPPGPPFFVRAADPAPGSTRVCLGATRVPGEFALMPCSDERVLRWDSKADALQFLCDYYLSKCTSGKSPLALIVDRLNDH